MPRPICPNCHYPQSHCLCSFVSPISSDIQFDILQHPSEVKAAKNTARLCALSLKSVTLWVGEKPDDFSRLIRLIGAEENTDTVVLYPDESSVPIEDYAQRNNNQLKKRVIVLDGTWKKAYKLWQLNAWLHAFPAVTLEGVESNYYIRKSPRPGGVSTLEAIFATLNVLEPDVNGQPLIDLFQARQMRFSQRGNS